MSFTFYIPRVSIRTTRKDIIKNFTNIGNVTSFDFIPANNRRGFTEKMGGDYGSAIVHISDLSTQGKELTNWMIRTGRAHKLYLVQEDMNNNEYWWLLKAKTSNQDTMPSPAQIVKNYRFLERKEKVQTRILEEQSQILEEQAATIRHLNQRLDGVHKVVEQLVGGLFCQNSQSKIMRLHMRGLYPEDYGYKRSRFIDDSNYHKWGSFPTTRQGDECDERISALEKEFESIINDHAYKGEDHEVRIRALEEQVKEMTKFASPEEMFNELS